MRFPFYNKILVLCICCLWASCANIVPPNGGKIDRIPPKLLSINPEDSSLNTRVTQIELRFDEYVTVGDVAKEVQVSPILSQNPSMTVKGKSVILKIPDSLLRNNTTYTISLGNSIKDLHEGNPYAGKTFIFSTGGWFDSLSIKGKIIDAATGRLDSIGGVKVLLYDAQDSADVVLKKKPLYVTNSKKGGNFSFTGLPQRRFKIFALKETNESLKFDEDEELIGFTDDIIESGVDTQSITLSIFKELIDSSKTLQSNDKSPSAGTSKKMKLNEVAKGVEEAAPSLDPKTFTYSLLIDTASRNKRSQDITKGIALFSSRPIIDFDSSKVMLSLDSLGTEIEQKMMFSIDSGRKKILLTPRWEPNKLYTLRVFMGMIKDSLGDVNMPAKYIFRSKSEEDYGKMEIKIPTKYVGSKYLLQVKHEDKILYLQNITQTTTTLKYLAPGSYTVALIEDLNADGAWTTGDLKARRQAELVIPYEAGALQMKAGWEHVINFEPNKKANK